MKRKPWQPIWRRFSKRHKWHYVYGETAVCNKRFDHIPKSIKETISESTPTGTIENFCRRCAGV